MRGGAAGRGAFVLLCALACACGRERSDESWVHDAQGWLDGAARARLEKQLALTRRETGVELRIELRTLDPSLGLERAAAGGFATAGGTRHQPGRRALVLWDARSRRLRFEVGYELEGVWPDAWIGELIHEHTRYLFDAGELEHGFALTLRILRDELRRAGLRGALGLPLTAAIRPMGFDSGGAGASDSAPLGTRALRPFARAGPLPAEASDPAPSVEESHARYLAWLARGRFETDLPLFTEETRAFLAAWPMTPGYLEHVRAREDGRSFEVIERGDRALVYCVDDPFVAPHFLRRGPSGWQIDLASEAREVINVAGGPFSWTLRAPTSPALSRFADALVSIAGHRRLRDGDNRRAAGFEPPSG